MQTPVARRQKNNFVRTRNNVATMCTVVSNVVINTRSGIICTWKSHQGVVTTNVVEKNYANLVLIRYRKAIETVKRVYRFSVCIGKLDYFQILDNFFPQYTRLIHFFNLQHSRKFNIKQNKVEKSFVSELVVSMNRWTMYVYTSFSALFVYSFRNNDEATVYINTCISSVREEKKEIVHFDLNFLDFFFTPESVVSTHNKRLRVFMRITT